ncbi:hypothetical protein R3P38DRAFT_2816429 [Favolaschia claudopus]|uniref:Uncharacterized protein n=1 Tax=Favolaschia claudopus TaxID=2862362 RepID=A0AAV9YYY5_9AGAR
MTEIKNQNQPRPSRQPLTWNKWRREDAEERISDAQAIQHEREMEQKMQLMFGLVLLERRTGAQGFVVIALSSVNSTIHIHTLGSENSLRFFPEQLRKEAQQPASVSAAHGINIQDRWPDEVQWGTPSNFSGPATQQLAYLGPARRILLEDSQPGLSRLLSLWCNVKDNEVDNMKAQEQHLLAYSSTLSMAVTPMQLHPVIRPSVPRPPANYYLSVLLCSGSSVEAYTHRVFAMKVWQEFPAKIKSQISGNYTSWKKSVKAITTLEYGVQCIPSDDRHPTVNIPPALDTVWEDPMPHPPPPRPYLVLNYENRASMHDMHGGMVMFWGQRPPTPTFSTHQGDQEVKDEQEFVSAHMTIRSGLGWRILLTALIIASGKMSTQPTVDIQGRRRCMANGAGWENG